MTVKMHTICEKDPSNARDDKSQHLDFYQTVLFVFYLFTPARKRKEIQLKQVKGKSFKFLKSIKWHSILTVGHSTLPLLMSSMTSWGGRPSMVQPTD